MKFHEGMLDVRGKGIFLGEIKAQLDNFSFAENLI